MAEAPRSGKGVLLRILEAEGFEILGQASGPDELRRLLAATDPQVIVFDAETSAMTVLSVRDWAPGVGVVVVWPSGVIATAADQQVEPSLAASDLGDAVRKAVRLRHEPVAPAPVEPDGALVEEVLGVAVTESAHSVVAAVARAPVGVPGSRRGELMIALASVTVLLVVATALWLRPSVRPGTLALPVVPGPFAVPTQVPQEPGQPGSLGDAGILDSLGMGSERLSGTRNGGGSSGQPAPDKGGGQNPGSEPPPEEGSPGGRPSDEPRDKDSGDNGHHGDGNSGDNGHHGDGNSGDNGHHGDHPD